MSRRGLTMLELLLALALMAALLGAMFAFLHELGDARAELAAAAARDRAIGDLFDGVERDLLAAIGSDAQAGAGVRGGAESLEILTRGVDLGAGARGDGASAALADLQRSGYRFVVGDGRIEHRRGDGGWAATTEGIGRVRFRYHDGSGWRDAFTSTGAQGLPRLVEIAVWHRMPETDDRADEFGPFIDELGGEGADAAEAGEPLDEALDADEPRPDRIRVIVVPDAEGSKEGDE